MEIPNEYTNRVQHANNKIQVACRHLSKKGRFLDIGCGTCNGVIAALQNEFTSAVGIDRSFSEFGWFDINYFDQYATQLGVDPTKSVLIEGDFFNLNFPSNSFDLVMMLDSIEHLPDPLSFIKRACDFVSNDGVLLIDTCPLYYSDRGHHLFSFFPEGSIPWPHLRYDFNDLLIKYKVDDWSLQRFHELNKITHQAIVNCILDSGLELVYEHRSVETPLMKKLLEDNIHFLNIEGIPKNQLYENWIFVVAKKNIHQK